MCILNNIYFKIHKAIIYELRFVYFLRIYIYMNKSFFFFVKVKIHLGIK